MEGEGKRIEGNRESGMKTEREGGGKKDRGCKKGEVEKETEEQRLP